MNRRSHLSYLALSALGLATLVPRNSWADSHSKKFQESLRQLELRSQGRLGVHLLDTANGQEFGHRSDERFMMLSSFKMLASALVLARVDSGEESLDRRIRYRKEDLVSWSPVTEKFVGDEGMTLAQLCHATITTSDNTAANLILGSYGGPAALTAFARKIGDFTTRLDRIEPELNTQSSAGPLDTTTPKAMAKTMQTLLLGNALSPSSREVLKSWLIANTTGGKRLKAGIPTGWTIGDKTGTNRTDSNDIGILYPPVGAPLIVTAYLAESTASSQLKDEALAEVARIITNMRS